jgi:L-iditol 2-dehydrogenase
MVHVPDEMLDEEATLIVTAGTAMYGLDVLGGIIAGEGVVVIGPGPIGLMGVGVAKALGAQPVILTGTRERRLEMGKRLGADAVVNVNNEDAVTAVQRITGGKGVQYVLEPKSGSWMIACVGRIGRTVGDGHISAIASASPNG